MMLAPDQIERYSRHILLSNVGGAGQQKLLASKVLIIGAGGLGSPVAYYLAAAGIGTIGLVDDDTVEVSNLQRQIVHFTDDVGKKKVCSAKEKLNRLNPDIRVDVIPERVDEDNVNDLIAKYDFIVDGSDNFHTKYLVNDACIMLKKPYSHAGLSRYDGLTMTVVPKSACYRCIFPTAPEPGSVPTCGEAGILGVVAGTLGVIQASEAIKVILETGKPLINRMLTVDMLNMEFTTVHVTRKTDCPTCGELVQTKG